MTPLERRGNPEPRYVAFDGGSINSMGLPNLGYPAYAKLIPELRRYGKPIVASIAGLQPTDFLEAVKAINEARPDLMEINLSCPNIPGKPQIGYDFQASEELLLKVRDLATPPIGVKLPPYFDPVHHQAMAEVLIRVGVSFVTLINSVGNGLVVDPDTESVVIKPKGGFGGLGGRIIKPVALANVRGILETLRGQCGYYWDGRSRDGTGYFRAPLMWGLGCTNRDDIGGGTGRSLWKA